MERKCPICGSENTEVFPSYVHGFLAERIWNRVDIMTTNMIHCKKCGFAYYEKRLSEEENARLYRNYRDEEYQRVREKYDKWYSKEINYAMGHDDRAIQSFKTFLEKVLSDHIFSVGGVFAARWITAAMRGNSFRTV